MASKSIIYKKNKFRGFAERIEEERKRVKPLIEEAKKLRIKGYTYREIIEKLDNKISRNTLSRNLKNIKLGKKAKERVRKNQIKALNENRDLANKVKVEKAKKENRNVNENHKNYKKNIKYRVKAIEMRKKGILVAEIMKIIPVSRGTLTNWFSRANLTFKNNQLIWQKIRCENAINGEPIYKRNCKTILYKDKAIAMRKAGKINSEILNEIPVCKKTLRKWFREEGILKSGYCDIRKSKNNINKKKVKKAKKELTEKEKFKRNRMRLLKKSWKKYLNKKKKEVEKAKNELENNNLSHEDFFYDAKYINHLYEDLNFEKLNNNE